MSSDGKTIGYTLRIGLEDARSYDCDLCSQNSPDIDAARAHRAVHVAGPDLYWALRAVIFQALQGKVLERDSCVAQGQQALAKAGPQEGPFTPTP